YLDVLALLLGLLFGQAHAGDLGVGEHNPGHRDPVLGGALACDHLGRDFPLLGRLVGEHGRPGNVTDRVDAFDIGLAQLVGHDEAPRINLDAELLQPNPARTRLHADGNQDLVTLDHLRLVARNCGDLRAPGGPFDLLRARSLEDPSAALGDGALDELDAVRIDTGEQAARQLNHGQLRTKRLIYHAEFQPDHPTTDDDETLGDLPQADRLARADDDFPIELEARDLDRRRSRRDDDRLGRGDPPLTASLFGDLDDALLDQLTSPPEE